MSELRLGGLAPFSATDYPGRLAAVLFCQGCPWRCHYCHNPHLQPPRGASGLRWSSALAWLERRRGLLDAVVFSGGEPTAQHSLLAAVKDARAMGFQIGLHTAGIYPKRLEPLLRCVDWVGFDVKSSFGCSQEVTQAHGSGLPAATSLRALLSSGLAHEVRTTVHPQVVPRERLMALASELAGLGVRRFVLQQFRDTGCADARLKTAAPDGYLDAALLGAIAAMFESFELRAA